VGVIDDRYKAPLFALQDCQLLVLDPQLYYTLLLGIVRLALEGFGLLLQFFAVAFRVLVVLPGILNRSHAVKVLAQLLSLLRVECAVAIFQLFHIGVGVFVLRPQGYVLILPLLHRFG
jgi:hypothetical protein